VLSEFLHEPEPINGAFPRVVKDVHLPERQKDFTVERRRNIVHRLRKTVFYRTALSSRRKERRMENRICRKPQGTASWWLLRLLAAPVQPEVQIIDFDLTGGWPQ
jgi:hypothetical protein